MTPKERIMNTSLLLLVPPGILSVAWALYNFPLNKVGGGMITLALVTIFLSAFVRVEIPRTKLHLTISDALVFLSLLVYGGGVAIILAMLEAGFSSFRLSRITNPGKTISKRTVLANILIAGFSTFATAFLVESLFGHEEAILRSGDNTMLAYLLALIAVAQFATNTFLASAYVAMRSDRKLMDVWNEQCLNALTLFASGALMAGLGAKAVEHMDMPQFALALGFFGLVSLALKRATDDVRNVSSEVERSEVARAAEADAHIAELNHFVDELKRSADELTESRENYRHAAYYDRLTDLPNRTYIIELIDQLLRDEGNSRFAVLLLNLNRFRTINESLGYQTGDRVIKHVAKQLRELARTGEIVGHFGGDEFAVILPGIAGEESVRTFTEEASKKLAGAIRFKGRQVYTNVGIGVVFNHPSHRKAEDLLRDADIAMYNAKDKNLGWLVFDKTMHSRAVMRQKLETDLRYAIVCNELEMFYQPIVELKSMKLAGFEALVRWNHPQKGMVFPNEFISVSEDTGLIIPMTLQALRTSCSQIVEWQEHSVENRYLTVSVNLSGKHFSDPGLVDQVRKIVKESGIAPETLKLEITESAAMVDAEKAIEKLNEVKKLGVKLSMDDFGTGYSSLSYLRRFPVDTLKIDRSFVSGMDESPENDEIVRTIMALAKAVRLDVVAEGIETVHQLNRLRRLGCEYGQGYLFARPLAVDAVKVLFENGTGWTELMDDPIYEPDINESDYSELSFPN